MQNAGHICKNVNIYLLLRKIRGNCSSKCRREIIVFLLKMSSRGLSHSCISAMLCWSGMNPVAAARRIDFGTNLFCLFEYS